MEIISNPQTIRPCTLQFVRNELAKIGATEEVIMYVWHSSNGRMSEANSYIECFHHENQMRIEQAMYPPEEDKKMPA